MRLWRGARVVTSVTQNTLYTRTNSLLMCFPFTAEHCRARCAPEDGVQQLQWSGGAVDALRLFVNMETLDTNGRCLLLLSHWCRRLVCSNRAFPRGFFKKEKSQRGRSKQVILIKGFLWEHIFSTFFISFRSNTTQKIKMYFILEKQIWTSVGVLEGLDFTTLFLWFENCTRFEKCVTRIYLKYIPFPSFE